MKSLFYRYYIVTYEVINQFYVQIFLCKAWIGCLTKFTTVESPKAPNWETPPYGCRAQRCAILGTFQARLQESIRTFNTNN